METCIKPRRAELESKVGQQGVKIYKKMSSENFVHPASSMSIYLICEYGAILKLAKTLEQIFKICAYTKDSELSDSEPHPLLSAN